MIRCSPMKLRDLNRANNSEQKIFAYIRSQCEREPLIIRAILFGSRARGDFQERSDFDIAIEAPSLSHDAWARLALRLREEIPTLCGLDLVRINTEISKDLLAKIKQEGLDLYVRK